MSTREGWDPDRKELLPKWREKRRLTRALQRAIEALVGRDVPEEELRDAAQVAEDWAERFEAHAPLRYELGRSEAAYAADVSAYFDQSPLGGLANPISPHLVMRREGERRVVATARFGAQFEGPPGHVHGGFVAAAFDEVLGYTQALGGSPGMTGRLTIHYRRPTPLDCELRIEGELLRSQGRRIYTHARMLASEVLTAEAEGLFVSVSDARRASMARARGGAGAWGDGS